MLFYQSKLTGARYQAVFYAASLVPERGTANLPPPLGELEVIDIDGPAAVRLGLDRPHPLQQLYSDIRIQHYFLVVADGQLVSRTPTSPKGVSLYVDWAGSGVCLEASSAMGRDIRAPWDWNGQPGTFTDPAALPHLEVRKFDDGKVWWNHGLHGVFTPDWLDGVPVTLDGMYDFHRGKVKQMVLVSKYLAGAGTAEQTLDPSEVKTTYITLLWFLRPEFDAIVHQHLGGGYTGRSTAESLSVSKEPMTKVRALSSDLADMKMATGGEIKQHVNPVLMSPGVFAPDPEVALVLHPMSEATAQRLLGRYSSSASRRPSF